MKLTGRLIVSFSLTMFGIGMVISRFIRIPPFSWRTCVGLSCVLVAIYWLMILANGLFMNTLTEEMEDKPKRKTKRVWFMEDL